MKKHWANPNCQNSEPTKRTVSILAIGPSYSTLLGRCASLLIPSELSWVELCATNDVQHIQSAHFTKSRSFRYLSSSKFWVNNSNNSLIGIVPGTAFLIIWATNLGYWFDFPIKFFLLQDLQDNHHRQFEGYGGRCCSRYQLPIKDQFLTASANWEGPQS